MDPRVDSRGLSTSGYSTRSTEQTETATIPAGPEARWVPRHWSSVTGRALLQPASISAVTLDMEGFAAHVGSVGGRRRLPGCEEVRLVMSCMRQL